MVFCTTRVLERVFTAGDILTKKCTPVLIPKYNAVAYSDKLLTTLWSLSVDINACLDLYVLCSEDFKRSQI